MGNYVKCNSRFPSGLESVCKTFLNRLVVRCATSDVHKTELLFADVKSSCIKKTHRNCTEKHAYTSIALGIGLNAANNIEDTRITSFDRSLASCGQNYVHTTATRN